MKLERAKNQYALPEDFYQIVAAYLKGEEGHTYALQTIRPEQWLKLTLDAEVASVLAKPIYVCVLDQEATLTIGVWPKPDADYEMAVRYMPPPKEV